MSQSAPLTFLLDTSPGHRPPLYVQFHTAKPPKKVIFSDMVPAPRPAGSVLQTGGTSGQYWIGTAEIKSGSHILLGRRSHNSLDRRSPNDLPEAPKNTQGLLLHPRTEMTGSATTYWTLLSI